VEIYIYAPFKYLVTREIPLQEGVSDRTGWSNNTGKH